MKSLPVIALCALLLAACAEMRWSKPGADQAAVSRDLDECRGNALRRAAPLGPGAPTADPQVPVDRAATPAGNRSATGSSNERFIAEHENVRVCMTGRGYQLQPAP